LIYTSPGEAFGLYVNIALIAGVAIASPFIMFQVWRFIAPALYTNEKKLAIPFVLLSSAGVIGGWLFSHYLLFPSTIRFFGHLQQPGSAVPCRASKTHSTSTRGCCWDGAGVPDADRGLFPGAMRMVTARFLARNTKYAILIIFIVAAVLTPDGSPWNQTLFAAPMIGLYVLSIGIAWAVAPRQT